MTEKKEPKTNKQKQIAKKFKEEHPDIAAERERLLTNFRFLGDWQQVLERQLNGYRDTIIMINNKRQEIMQKIEVLGSEPIQELETEQEG